MRAEEISELLPFMTAEERAQLPSLMLAASINDPLAFVQLAFPWGQPGPLLNREIETWQVELLTHVRDGLLTIGDAIRAARASGHGIGKSAIVAWLILWAMSKKDTRGVVTANTENQLRTKTWPELAKWFRIFAYRDRFKLTATALFSSNPQHEKTWRIDAVPWSENNTEAFAGLHNEGNRILVIFDEGSAIPDIIWETTEGALTDANTEILWLVFGNPTKNTGRFRECFGKLKHRWNNKQVDSRTVSITNKQQIEQWATDYGDDSDFFRVRVKGQFPRASSMQFMPGDLVAAARTRVIVPETGMPLVGGVDVARFGDDQSVIALRRGFNARSIPWVRLRNADTMKLVGVISELHALHRVDMWFVDGGAMGPGVIDRMRQLHIPVIEVGFGNKPDRPDLTGSRLPSHDKAAEMWGYMRDWMRGGALPDEQEIEDDLTGREYGYDNHNAVMLERKRDMKARGLASPDNSDALGLTFAYPVAGGASLPKRDRYGRGRSSVGGGWA